MRREEKSKTPNLKRQFLKTLDHQAWHDTYQQTKDPILLEKLNSAYSDFVNYGDTLPYQTNINTKPYVRTTLSKYARISLRKSDTLDHKAKSPQPLKIDHWGAVLKTRNC